MPEMKSDNSQLEEFLEKFAKDRRKEDYARFMEQLEKSVIFVPVMPLQGLNPETMEQIKAGKPVRLSKDTKIVPCLLRKGNGEQVLPVFTSPAQIPQDKKSPAVLTMPFWSCLSMTVANREKLTAMVVNPFTQNLVLPWSVLDVAEKRRALAQGGADKAAAQQLLEIVHNRIAMSILPKYLFDKKEEGLSRLQKEEGAFLLALYGGLYPQGKKPPYKEDDFSVMTLNVTETMQLTRVDLPEEAMRKGACYRIYAVWKREAQELSYYILEKTKQGNYIGTISAAGEHALLKPVPENGAEIEAVMELAADGES